MRLRILQAISIVTLVGLTAAPALAQRRNEKVTIKRGGFGADDFTPKTGAVGTTVIITGRGFTPETKVLLGGRLVGLGQVQPTQITFTVPPTFGDGSIVLRQPGVAKDVFVGKIAIAANPEVRRLAPRSGVAGTRVEIHGSGFQPGDQVLMNGRPIRVVQLTPNRILVEIPMDAQSDYLTVSRPGGLTAGSKDRFEVAKPAPTVIGIAPQRGTVGSTVRLTGTNLDTVRAVRYGNTTLRILAQTAAHLDVELSAGVSGNQFFTVEGVAGSARAPVAFTLEEPPMIARFSPTMGLEGQRVEVFGENFRAGASLTLGGVPVRIIQLREKRLLIEIPQGAISGVLSLTQGVERATSAAAFEVLHVPVISSMSPAGGAVGQRVVISGQHFTTETTVSYGATALRIERRLGDSQLEVIIPRRAADQAFTVRTRGGEATTPVFRVHHYPVVRGTSPTQGFMGTVIEITGVDLNYVDTVRLGNVALPIIDRQPRRITARVIEPATGGPITVEAFGHVTDTRASFVLLSEPVISSFSPAAVAPGAQLAITGQHFSRTSTVLFGDREIPISRRVLPNQLIVEIPRGFATGTNYLWVVDGTARTRATTPLSISTPPNVLSFAPEFGKPGTMVTVRGEFFGPNTVVSFDGLAAVVSARRGSNELIVQIPFTATNANPYFSVRDEKGESRAARAFKLLPAARIAGFAQPSGHPGDKILVKGSGFDATTRLYWGSLPLTVDKIGPRGHRIWFIVPNVAGGTDFVTADDNGAKSVSPVQFKIDSPPPPPPPPPGKIKVRDHRKK